MVAEAGGGYPGIGPICMGWRWEWESWLWEVLSVQFKSTRGSLLLRFEGENGDHWRAAVLLTLATLWQVFAKSQTDQSCFQIASWLAMKTEDARWPRDGR